jgi:hypothetical protein
MFTSRISQIFGSRYEVALVCGLLTLFAILCFFSQTNKSVTVDEFNHFPSGIYNLLTGDWRMDRESPPLIKCFPGFSSLFTQPVIHTSSRQAEPNGWEFGYDFMHQNYNRYISIFEWGRVFIIFLGTLGGYILYRFTKEIFGRKGAVFALVLYVFNPNILAHSRLLTIDIGATTLFLLAVFGFWKFLKKTDIKWAFLGGIFLGMAQLSKFTCLILYPIFFAFFVITLIQWAWIQKQNHNLPTSKIIAISGRCIAMFLFLLLISLFVINLGYGFSNTLFFMQNGHFSSHLLKAVSSSSIQNIPIPLPLEYVRGFDVQLDISSGKSPFYMGYLMGEHSMEGWIYYYLIGLLVKNPEGMFVIVLLSLFAWIKTKPALELRTWLCVWGTALIYLVYFSIFTNTPIGIRFMLPILPLFFLAAASLFGKNFVRKGRANLFLGIIAILYILPTILSYPNYLSYFNRASGGSQNGHRWLMDSNLDWGQDLPALKKYMETKGIDRVKLGYFGRVDPRIYGIAYDTAKRKIEAGSVHAISVNFLIGRPYYLLEKNNRLSLIGFNYYQNYRNLKPKAILANTIYIFEENEL